MNAKRELPPKESAVFKNILKNYELRQYKKGLKLADSILKKFPEHGETLAMKGLFLNNLDKKEEGYDHVKKGIRHDITSHICWHVYGLLHRADKNYEEAAKCYTQALKFNKNDIQILRDFALMQTQLRQYDGLVETRSQLVQLQPSNPTFWLGLAIAYQMVGKPETGVKILESHEESLKTTPPAFEYSELLMYHNSLLEETGDFKAALEHLNKIEPKVTDKRTLKEKRAFYLFRLGQLDEAESGYRLLISENPFNGRYIERLLEVKGLGQADKKAETSELLTELFAQYPRSKAIEDLVLRYAEGESFKTKVAATLQSALRKGVPSLFNSMKKFYGDESKQKIIADLVIDYGKSLEACGSFTGSEDTKEPATALLWTLYYLAQHYDYHRQLDQALEHINKAIEHTPTVVELYMTKGRILKHAGKFEEAAQVMDEGRKLDLQDRFINSKCAKYMLRASHIEEAEKTIGLFTRKDVAPLQDLLDMQCQWFVTEEGFAYMRKKNYGKALKRFHAIEKFYNDFYDDQFDFHTYCLRKTTLRAYVDMLRFEDRLRAHPFYLKAAKGAVEAYLAIADQPKDGSFDPTGMTETEVKKAKSKARKAELKAQKENEARKALIKEEIAKQQKADPKKPVDQDPEGDKYLETGHPLDDALQFVKPLEQLAPSLIDTHTLGFEIYIRQKKWLLALTAILKTSQIDASHSSIKTNLDRFQKQVSAAGPLDPTVQKVIDEQLPKIKQA
ncbi:NMDA receptor-regulated protein 1-domain-containing protein [Radiomyces spectabilis]|uniref:NMDA receptor-regulated protein 1-domain-containing protein n=1 Tax=Radiomyces spectabilis TaxID=64574 RepID=UPI00221F1CBB|nr:NMDA receptor-regulated protein 1-domain-containing protein [Radiomyces spectabilis]KAI8365330.1 NMDA receptor-regulated protein 1-domain-containing protein [Radiomyces spectabilis]